jgi:S-formylglutathione hydrolase FrmB
MRDLRPGADWPKGRILKLQHRSELLRDNPWNDPHEREVSIYLPHGYSESGAPYRALWDLAAYTSAGPAHLNWRNQGENLVARLDRLIGQGVMDPVIVVIPDCYTSLGGNQYVNSPAVGPYADYICHELLPFVEEHTNALGGRAGRALFGKSSGGYGALTLAMKYPELWGAAASHAGDVGFDLVYRKDFPVAAELLAAFKGDALAFMRAFWRKNRPTGRDYTAMMILAMAASYDPDEKDPRRLRLPFDLRTCALDERRWARWLACDPLNMLDEHLRALRSLHGLYLDVGLYDQYYIHFGTRLLSDRLNEKGIDHHFEEFDGTHSAIDWRLDHSLPWLVRALKKEAGEPINA